MTLKLICRFLALQEAYRESEGTRGILVKSVIKSLSAIDPRVPLTAKKSERDEEFDGRKMPQQSENQDISLTTMRSETEIIPKCRIFNLLSDTVDENRSDQAEKNSIPTSSPNHVKASFDAKTQLTPSEIFQSLYKGIRLRTRRLRTS